MATSPFIGLIPCLGSQQLLSADRATCGWVSAVTLYGRPFPFPL